MATLRDLGRISKAEATRKEKAAMYGGTGAVLGGAIASSIPQTVTTHPGGWSADQIQHALRTNQKLPDLKSRSSYTGIGMENDLKSSAMRYHKQGADLPGPSKPRLGVSRASVDGVKGYSAGRKFITRGALASRAGGGALIVGGLGTTVAANAKRKRRGRAVQER